MSDKLRKQIALERQDLNHLLDVSRPLLIKCANEAPSEIELWALAAMLHSFYNGVENIFKQIVTESERRRRQASRGIVNCLMR